MYTLDTVIYSPERSKNSNRIVISKSVVEAIYRIGKAGRDSMSVSDVLYVINNNARPGELLTFGQVEREMKKIAADYANGMYYKWLAKGKVFSSLDGYFFQYK